MTRHGAGPQQALHRTGRRLAVPLVQRVESLGGGGDVHHHPDDAGLELGVLREAGVPEDLHHPCVLEQGVRREALQAVAASFTGQVLEQEGANAEPLVGVVDDESHLGYVAAGDAVVLGDADELAGSARLPGPDGQGLPFRPGGPARLQIGAGERRNSANAPSLLTGGRAAPLSRGCHLAKRAGPGPSSRRPISRPMPAGAYWKKGLASVAPFWSRKPWPVLPPGQEFQGDAENRGLAAVYEGQPGRDI